MAYTEKQNGFVSKDNIEARHGGLLRAARDLIVVKGNGGNEYE